MKLNNIIYLFDNEIIEYNNKDYFKHVFSENILKNGIILNKSKFINEYKDFLKKNKLNTFIKRPKIIIYNSFISINDLNMIKETFNDLVINVKKYIKDVSLINFSKNDSYLIGNKILKLLYVTPFNTKKILSFNIEDYNIKEIKFIIKSKVKNNLILISNNENLCEKFSDIKNFYVINNLEKYLIKSLKNKLS